MSKGSHRSVTPAGTAPAGIAIVVPHAAVLLPAGVAASIVERIWRVIADPAVAAESIVAELPLRGSDEAASFAVVVHERVAPSAPGSAGVRLSIVLRGDAVLDVAAGAGGGVRRIDARRAAPFYIAALDRVSAYRIGSAADPLTTGTGIATSAGMPIVAGVVASSGVVWDHAIDAAQSGLPSVLPAGMQTATVLDPAPMVVAAPFAPRAVDPTPERRRRGAHAVSDAVTDGAPVGRARTERPQQGRGRRAADPEAADAGVRAASVSTAVVPTASADAADPTRAVYGFRIVHDGDSALPAGGTEGHADAGTDTGPGARIPLDAPAVIGRHPRPPRVVRGADPRLIRVPSPLGEISGTHLGIRQESGTVVVTDLHSTNGTVVLAPGAERLALRPGESLVVVPGTRIDIGDGTLLEILSAR